jgi:hypothetical protein
MSELQCVQISSARLHELEYIEKKYDQIVLAGVKKVINNESHLKKKEKYAKTVIFMKK